jgi:hypothetical protein
MERERLQRSERRKEAERKLAEHRRLQELADEQLARQLREAELLRCDEETARSGSPEAAGHSGQSVLPG